MTLDEQIEILENNAEFERKDGDLNSCLNFRQLAEWLKDYKRLKEQKPCDDCISRQTVLDAMYELCDTGETLKDNPWRDNPHIDAVVETIERLPSVKPYPKKGHWIEKQEEDDCEPFILWECNNCHNTVLRGHFRKYSYCPNCGVKMIETQESEMQEVEE